MAASLLEEGWQVAYSWAVTQVTVLSDSRHSTVSASGVFRDYRR